MLSTSKALQNLTSIGDRRKPNRCRRAWQSTVVVLVFITILFLVSERPNEPGDAGKTLTHWLLKNNASWVWIPNVVYEPTHDELWYKVRNSGDGMETLGMNFGRTSSDKIPEPTSTGRFRGGLFLLQTSSASPSGTLAQTAFRD